MPARGKWTYLSLNILREIPARGRRTYPLRNIFKEMQAQIRRTYLPRNIFKVVQTRGRRIYRAYGPAVGVVFTAALTETISAFPETSIDTCCLVVDEC
jgi:hypothetical protein